MSAPDLTPVEQDLHNLLRLATAPGTSTSEFKGTVTATLIALAVAVVTWLNPNGKITGIEQTAIAGGAAGVTGLLWRAYGIGRKEVKIEALKHPLLGELAGAMRHLIGSESQSATLNGGLTVAAVPGASAGIAATAAGHGLPASAPISTAPTVPAA